MGILWAGSTVLFTLDWGQVLSAVIGASVGATIGVVGTATVSRNARRYADEQAKSAALESAIENLLRALADLTAAATSWQWVVKMATWAPGDRPTAPPNAGAVSVALELVKLRAPVTERDATDRLSAAWDRIEPSSGGNQASACGLFAGAVVAWRAGEGIRAVESALRSATIAAEEGTINTD